MTLRIVEALDAYLQEVDKGLAGDTTAEIGKKFEELRQARKDMTFADDAEIDRAREEYAQGSDDDIEIDDGAASSVADDGVWVQAWVWLPNENACRECGEHNDGEGYDGLCGNCADRAEAKNEEEGEG